MPAPMRSDASWAANQADSTNGGKGHRPYSSELRVKGDTSVRRIVTEPDVPPYPDNACIRLDSELFESASFASERQLSMEFTLPRHSFGMSISRFGQQQPNRRTGRMLT